MTDLKYLSKKVELRWWWFNFDLRTRKTAIIDFLTGVAVLVVSGAFSLLLLAIGFGWL